MDHPWPGGRGRARGRILKLLCFDEARLRAWGAAHGVPPDALDRKGGIPHFDFLGEQREALLRQGWPVAAVRLATAADATAIGDLARKTWAATYGGMIPPEVQAQMLDEAYALDEVVRRIRRAERFLVAKTPDGGICGFADFVREGAGVFLAALYVAPEHQGRGVGSLLLNRGPTGPMRLEVFAANVASIGFYSSHGFTPDGESPTPSFGAPILRMRRPG